MEATDPHLYCTAKNKCNGLIILGASAHSVRARRRLAVTAKPQKSPMKTTERLPTDLSPDLSTEALLAGHSAARDGWAKVEARFDFAQHRLRAKGGNSLGAKDGTLFSPVAGFSV